MTAEINEKAFEQTKREAIALATRDLSGLPANFARECTRKIIEMYLENCEKIKAEEERQRKEKENEALDQMMADTGWFPGECCD